MKHQTISTIARMSDAKLINVKDLNSPVHAISTDTRTIKPGDIYVPLIGERLDGHEFIDKAFEKGALACFCDKNHIKNDGNIYLIVDDTLKAMQLLAKNYRNSLNTTIVGLTGSNGKTTTKDIIHSILKRKYRSQKTIGNLNNAIGVPRTLLELDEDTEVGVVEMGMDTFGEISLYVDMANPHISIITNIGDSHLQELGSKENVAKAKLEILENMTEDDIFIYNLDDEVLKSEVEKLDILPRVITYGKSQDADYRITPLSSGLQGSKFLINGESYHINLLGSFQVYNAAVAIIVAIEMGLSPIEIQKGLNVEDQTAMRTELISCDGFDILNDSYKSNPQSLLEALNTAKLLAGYKRKIAILGDMLELGTTEAELHFNVGQNIDSSAIDYILFYGPLSKDMMRGAAENFSNDRIFHFDSKPDLVDKAKYLISKNSLVLVKGSRALRMEEIIESIKDITTC